MWNFEHESLSSFSFSFRTIWTRVPSNSRRVFVDWDVLTRGRTVIDSSPIVNFGRTQNSHSSFPFPFVVLAKNEAWRAKKCVQSHSMPDIDARNLSLVAFFFDVLPWFDVRRKGKKEKGEEENDTGFQAIRTNYQFVERKRKKLLKVSTKFSNDQYNRSKATKRNLHRHLNLNLNFEHRLKFEIALRASAITHRVTRSILSISFARTAGR